MAAVADGAGSAALGEVGAAVAAHAGVEKLYSQLTQPLGPQDDKAWHSLLTEGLKAAKDAIEAEAMEKQVQARDLATTLILVVATPGVVAAAQVGDGAAVAGDAEGNMKALTAPQSGEYINETTFLISPDALERAQVTVWRGSVSHVAVFSDGLQMLALKMPEGTPYTPFFSPLFRFVADVTDESGAQE
jgi:serine/threonine protein phosphatase PrpC